MIERLEDAANASTIPRVAIFSIEKGFDKPVVENLNNVIRKWDTNNKMADVEHKINEGLLNYDVKTPAEEVERQETA